jgi:hypothetical protein
MSSVMANARTQCGHISRASDAARPHECLVVGDEDADHGVRVGSRAHSEPALDGPSGLERAAVQPYPFAHPGDPVATPRPVRTASTVVDYLKLDVVAVVANGHPRVGGSRVLERVRQGLLHDPLGREVDAGRQSSRLALDGELHGQTDVAHLPGIVAFPIAVAIALLQPERLPSGCNTRGP